MVSGPNLASYLILYSPEIKMFFILKNGWGEKSKEDYFLTHDNYMKFKF